MEEMPNPFVCGPVVTGPDFVDRESELRDLGRRIRSGKSVVLYSNRRMGKSSLLAEMIRRRDDDLVFVYLNTYGITEPRRFAEAFAQEVMRSSVSKTRRLMSSVVEALKGTGLRLVFTEAGEGYPYYVQHVAYELFQISLRPSLEDVESAVRSTVEHQSHAFMNIWESVRSQLHRRYLLAAAMEPGSPQGVAFIERHNLRSVSHVHRIRTQLERRGVLEDGRLVDPFFAMWLRVKGTGQVAENTGP